MFWCDRRGTFANCANNQGSIASNPVVNFPSSPISESMKKTLQSHEFTVPIFSNQSVAKFWFEVDQGSGNAPLKHNNGGQGYILQQDQIIFLPYLKEDIATPDGKETFVLLAGVSLLYRYFSPGLWLTCRRSSRCERSLLPALLNSQLGESLPLHSRQSSQQFSSKLMRPDPRPTTLMDIAFGQAPL